jgi:hypothetical protein
MVSGYIVLYAAFLCLVGGPLVLLICSINTVGRDLYEAFKQEFNPETGEKMDAFLRVLQNKFLDGDRKEKQLSLEETVSSLINKEEPPH